MKRSTFITWEQLRVTLVIAAAALIIGMAMIALGRAANLFSKRYELVAFLNDANGLRPGGPVMVAGKLSGTIASIEFLPVSADSTRKLEFHLSLDTRVREQVRRDSRGGVRSLGLLGDKIINIVPGTPRAQPLHDGDTLRLEPALDYEALIAHASTAVDELVALSTDVRKLTTNLVNGRGTIGQLLTNRSLYDQLDGTLTRTTAMLERVQNSHGTLAKMLDDPVLYDRLVGSVTSVDSLVTAFSNKNGTLGRLVNDTLVYTNLSVMTSRLASMAGAADSLIRSLKTGDGTLSKVLNDPKLYDELTKLLSDISAMLADIRQDPRRYLRGVIQFKPF
jgi:phospholipid/cholesterol/gamma-HCH transport system substrate-binding protein